METIWYSELGRTYVDLDLSVVLFCRFVCRLQCLPSQVLVLVMASHSLPKSKWVLLESTILAFQPLEFTWNWEARQSFSSRAHMARLLACQISMNMPHLSHIPGILLETVPWRGPMWICSVCTWWTTGFLQPPERGSVDVNPLCIHLTLEYG